MLASFARSSISRSGLMPVLSVASSRSTRSSDSPSGLLGYLSYFRVESEHTMFRVNRQVRSHDFVRFYSLAGRSAACGCP